MPAAAKARGLDHPLWSGCAALHSSWSLAVSPVWYIAIFPNTRKSFTIGKLSHLPMKGVEHQRPTDCSAQQVQPTIEHFFCPRKRAVRTVRISVPLQMLSPPSVAYYTVPLYQVQLYHILWRRLPFWSAGAIIKTEHIIFLVGCPPSAQAAIKIVIAAGNPTAFKA